MKVKLSKGWFVTLLFLAPVLIGISYGTLEYYGLIDKIFSIEELNTSASRLSNAKGYPVNLIINDEKDKKDFELLYDLILKNSENKNINVRIKNGEKPSFISPVGVMNPISNVPDNWPQEYRFYYSPNHPVILGFDHFREKIENGSIAPEQIEYIGNIGDFDYWIKLKKRFITYWIGLITVGCISMSLIMIRLNLQKRK